MTMSTPRPGRRSSQQRAQRSPVSMSASIATTSAYQFPDLADISKTGARLQGIRLPPVGSTALLKAGPLEVLCKIIWVRDGQCGIRFDELVSHAILNQVHREGAVGARNAT